MSQLKSQFKSQFKSKCCQKILSKGKACKRCPLAAHLDGRKLPKKVRKRLDKCLVAAASQKRAA